MRNPIYQAFPARPSSATLCNARLAGFLYGMALSGKPSRRRMLGCCRVRGPLQYCATQFTCLVRETTIRPDVDVPFFSIWRLLSYHSVCFSLADIFPWTLSSVTPRSRSPDSRFTTTHGDHFARSAIGGSMSTIGHAFQSPRSRAAWPRMYRNAITFHVPISLIRRTVIALFAAAHHPALAWVSAHSRAGK